MPDPQVKIHFSLLPHDFKVTAIVDVSTGWRLAKTPPVAYRIALFVDDVFRPIYNSSPGI